MIDLSLRRIVEWQLRSEMTESLVLSALRSAIRERQPEAGLIHHSDRDGQYAGTEYRSVLRRAGIRQSMTRPANYYDKSFKESFLATFKMDFALTDYKSIEEGRREIADYIRYYNNDRKHSALSYLTPARFEQFIHDSEQGNDLSLELSAPHRNVPPKVWPPSDVSSNATRGTNSRSVKLEHQPQRSL
jgi:putative transposase